MQQSHFRHFRLMRKKAGSRIFRLIDIKIGVNNFYTVSLGLILVSIIWFLDLQI